MNKKPKTDWLQQITQKARAGDLVVIPKTQPPGGWLDEEARDLLRLGAIRLLRCVAGVDDEGNTQKMDPRTAREAISALSLLFDRVPDVLTFETRSNAAAGEIITGAPTLTTADLLTADGRELMKTAIREIPPDILKDAIGKC